MKTWSGEDLEGEWIASIKIDGVRMLRDEHGNPVSRNNKPLYNLESVPKEIVDCEIYYSSWEETISLVRSKSKKVVPESSVYSLDPLDERLYIKKLIYPAKEEILKLLKFYTDLGYEGLVLRSDKLWVKVKNKDTVDLEVRGYQNGAGRLEGKLGALITDYGKVGTGFKDSERDKDLYPIGSIIEVGYMEKTGSGKLRHPRFIRRRYDKDELSVGD
jgi:ATP-dependent DNA ligase